MLDRGADIDARVWIGEIEEGSIASKGADLMASLGAGRSSPDGRAILFVYDVRGQRLRVEVSHALEGLFPDALLGDLLYTHARHLFESGEPEFAIRLGLRVLNHRLRLARLEGDFVDGAPLPDPSVPWTAGAGADELMRATETSPIIEPAQRDPIAYGPMALHEVHERYLEWLAEPHFDRSPAFLTPESRQLVSRFPMTPGYREFILLKEIGSSFGVAESGDRAIRFSTSDPFVAPHFYRLTDDGWQMDLVAEVTEVVNLGAGPYTWTFADGPYTRALSGQLVRVGDVVRARGGDNRRVPAGASLRGDR